MLAAVACVWGVASAQELLDSTLQVTTVVSALQQPTAFAILPTSSAAPRELLVCEKATGRVRHVRGGQVIATSLDLAVNSVNERGLLGIALHPDFASNGFVYVYFTRSNTGTDSTNQTGAQEHAVERYVWDGRVLTLPTQIVALPATPGPNHDGGILLFGPDGKLYGVIGDLNRNGQLQNFELGLLPDDTGIIFRLNDDGSEPADNPFVALGGNMRKVYAYGVRNSFGMDFDPVTDTLWDTENGPSVMDEINRVLPGFNSGWEDLMGPDARDSNDVSDLWHAEGSHYADPVFSWRSPIGVTSIHFVRGEALGPNYVNHVLVGDSNTGALYRFELDATRSGFTFSAPGTSDAVADTNAERDAFLFGTNFGVVTDIETGPDGVYVCALAGTIYRLTTLPTAVEGSNWGHVKSLYR